jgi:tRNA-modifying protein YgfZ
VANRTPKLFDLSARTKLRIGGSDRARYLNGQITNDVRKATGDRAIYATILNTKGRIDADLFIRETGDAFLVDADEALREELPVRLERYVIADDVTIDDVTDNYALFHLIDANQVSGVANPRFGCPGIDLWIEGSEREKVLRELMPTAASYDGARAETFRIENGVPRWGHELSQDIIPVEANLESSAIDYVKGCYIGQEVISRMKMSGQTNKRLRGLVSIDDTPLRTGTRLFPAGDATRDVGWITSATRSDNLRRQIGLAFVKRGYNDAGTSLLADGRKVEVVELPFV